MKKEALASADMRSTQPEQQEISFNVKWLGQSILLGCLTLFMVLPWTNIALHAQGVEPVWDTPFNVSDSLDASVTPTITCDAFGIVHVFWSEKTQGEPSEFPGRDTGDSIFYRQLRDGEWSSAIDVAFAGEGESFLLQPVAGTDNDGTVYLIWSGYRGVYFSYAPIASATMAAAWSPPVLVAPINPIGDFSGPVKRPRLVVDEAHHSLHVIYSLYGTNGNLFYLRSPDMGQTWDEPRPLTDVTQARAADEVNANGRIVLDQTGNLHVIWDYVVKQGEDWLGQAIKHLTSTDNGDTWSTPSDVAVAWQGARWWGVPDVVATSDKLHVIFACGDRPRRCYTYSGDGGKTWERLQPLFGDFMSLAGWDSMTVDMNDNVHLIAQLRDLQNETYVWHAALGDDGWPVQPSRTPLEMWMADHFPESCISLGNEMHFVMAQEQQGEVWHLAGKIYPRGVAASAFPAPTKAVEVTPQTEILDAGTRVTATPSADQVSLPIVNGLASGRDSAGLTLIISVLPVLILIAGVMLHKMRTK